MNEVNPLTEYIVKIVAGAVAFGVWILSVISPPILAIDAGAQGILFGAAVVAFGWGVTQGAGAVRSAERLETFLVGEDLRMVAGTD